MLRSILFTIFINDLDSGMMCTFGKFVDKIKLGRVTDTPDGCAITQRDLNRLENRAERNLMKFNGRKYKILHTERNNPRHQHTVGTNSLKISFEERALGILVDKLNMHPPSKEGQQYHRLHYKRCCHQVGEVVLPLNSNSNFSNLKDSIIL